MAEQQKIRPIEVTVQARVLWFCEQDEPNVVYVVYADGAEHSPRQGPEAKLATGLLSWGNEDRYFLVYCEDCFDPPVAVVWADHANQAEEIFADELPWSHLDGSALADYGPDSYLVGWNSSGQAYLRENIMIRELRLVRVDLA